MRFTTIWDPRINFSMRERLRQTAEWFWMETARRLPKKLRLWVFIIEGGRYMHNDTVPEALYMDIYKRMYHDVMEHERAA